MKFIFEDSCKTKYDRNRNKKIYNEKLVEAPQEVVDEVVKVLDSYGFVLDPAFKVNPGKTWMGNIHMQVINTKEPVGSHYDLKRYVPNELVDELREIENTSKCPITWNFGINRDGYVTGGIDISEKYVEENLEESFSQSVRNKYKDEDLHLVSNRYSPDDPGDDEYDIDDTDFNDVEVEEGNRFFADGKDYTWEERIAGPIHLDFDNWAVWSARESVNILDYATEKPGGGYKVDKDAVMKAYMAAPVVYFVVDEDTGFIDWGPCDTDIEAKDFLNGKQNDWENDY